MRRAQLQLLHWQLKQMEDSLDEHLVSQVPMKSSAIHSDASHADLPSEVDTHNMVNEESSAEYSEASLARTRNLVSQVLEESSATLSEGSHADMLAEASQVDNGDIAAQPLEVASAVEQHSEAFVDLRYLQLKVYNFTRHTVDLRNLQLKVHNFTRHTVDLRNLELKKYNFTRKGASSHEQGDISENDNSSYDLLTKDEFNGENFDKVFGLLEHSQLGMSLEEIALSLLLSKREVQIAVDAGVQLCCLKSTNGRIQCNLGWRVGVTGTD